LRMQFLAAISGIQYRPAFVHVSHILKDRISAFPIWTVTVHQLISWITGHTDIELASATSQPNCRVGDRTDTIRQDFAVNSRSVVAVDSSNGPAGGKDFETMTSGG